MSGSTPPKRSLDGAPSWLWSDPLRERSERMGRGFSKCLGREVDCPGQLDADAELAGVLLARIGVEVVRSALLEPGAAAQLGAKEDADGGDCDSDREPGDDAQGGGARLLRRGSLLDRQLNFRLGVHRTKPPTPFNDSADEDFAAVRK